MEQQDGRRVNLGTFSLTGHSSFVTDEQFSSLWTLESNFSELGSNEAGKGRLESFKVQDIVLPPMEHTIQQERY